MDTCEFSVFTVLLVENTTFDKGFVNFRLNVTTFGMSIDIVAIDKSHDFLVAMDTTLARNYEFLNYQMCVFIQWPAWPRIKINS